MIRGMKTLRRTDVVIAGAGFAGAATAYHLSRSFRGSILLLEREKIPGAHASGRNASLLLQSVADPALRRCAAASREAYVDVRREIGFEEVGSLLLGSPGQLARLREPELVPSRILAPEEAVDQAPLLDGYDFENALSTPGDGVIDTWALLNHYLNVARSRGVEVLLDCEIREVSAGSTWRLETSHGEIEADCLVNGAGAWASELACLAGLEAPVLAPYKRHLFVLDGVEPVEVERPFVWSLEPEFYFRPESGGMLFSVCDEARSTCLVETVSPGIEETLAELVTARLPRFENARVRSVWSCFRTKTDDGRFVIGRDPMAESFVWVAGLGGHGMGCSWEVGRLGAEAVLGSRPTAPFDPARFAPVAALAG